MSITEGGDNRIVDTPDEGSIEPEALPENKQPASDSPRESSRRTFLTEAGIALIGGAVGAILGPFTQEWVSDWLEDEPNLTLHGSYVPTYSESGETNPYPWVVTLRNSGELHLDGVELNVLLSASIESATEGGLFEVADWQILSNPLLIAGRVQIEDVPSYVESWKSYILNLGRLNPGDSASVSFSTTGEVISARCSAQAQGFSSGEVEIVDFVTYSTVVPTESPP